ncbi:hypothetical protein MU516_07690 [Paracoccus sp. YLB-12]|uniref:DUF2946 domain-containing protein n=1 Tax=Paracoccus maritimus TaxID=2933292 RepID=A0ABT2KA32_9RHOB|nr:hypothetical protein [Paracoccus sp. YLB-12]MCT4332749.1 hypothetical protein [Paracoccus sp. YLB-12]
MLDETITDKPSPMGRLQVMIWNRAVSVLCALALVLVAFGHRPVETDPRLSDPQIAAYLALGGSLADLCLSGDDGQDHAAHADCPACTIAKSMALVLACFAPSDLVVWSGHHAAWPETLVLTGHGPRAPPARGPPSIQLI